MDRRSRLMLVFLALFCLPGVLVMTLRRNQGLLVEVHNVGSRPEGLWVRAVPGDMPLLWDTYKWGFVAHLRPGQKVRTGLWHQYKPGTQHRTIQVQAGQKGPESGPFLQIEPWMLEEFGKDRLVRLEIDDGDLRVVPPQRH